MSMTFTGLKALGKAMRLKSPVDTHIPVEMQMALLRLAVGEKAEPRFQTPRLLAEQELAEQEMTEQPREDGNEPQKARLSG